MKVLLLSANTLNEPYPVYPIGLDYVAAALSDRHQVAIADLNTLDTDAIARYLRDAGPDVVGVSLRNVDNTDRSDTKAFAGAYKKLIADIRQHTDAIIVLGGSGFTIFPEAFMEMLDADYGIVGEGERIALLLAALEAGAVAESIPGVVRRGEPCVLPPPLGLEFKRGFDARRTHIRYYLEKGGMMNVQTKRGCHFNCIYCTYPHVEGRALRLIPPETVARNARQLQDAGARYLFITDSAFNADIDHSLAVAAAFKQAGVSLPWGAFFAPVPLPDGYFTKMAAAGLTHVEFGTESLSDPVLAMYRKPFRVEHVFTAHRDAIAAGLYAAHYFLLGGPGETPETISETLSNVEKLERTVLFFFCGMRIYPHTALYDLSVREHVITAETSLLKPVFYNNDAIDGDAVINRVRQAAATRSNWVVGAGGDETARVLSRLYARGFTGPLWEYLIR